MPPTPGPAAVAPDVVRPVLDELTSLARQLLGSAAALVSIVRADTLQWLASAPDSTPVDQDLPAHAVWSAPTVFCQQVVATGAPLLVPDTRELADDAAVPSDALVDLHTRAYCGVPLTGAAGEVVGVLCAVETAPRSWTAADVRALTQLAVLASSELTARQRGAESAVSQRRAENATGHAQLLLRLSEALADTATVTDVAREVSVAAAETLGVPWSYVGLLDGRAPVVRFVPVPGRDGDEDPAWQSVPLGDADPAGWVGVHGEPIFFEDAAALLARHPGTWSPEDGPVAYEATAHLPLSVGGRQIGVLSLVFDRVRRWTAQDKAAKLALARYTAQALDRALLLADRVSVARTLQRAMMTDLPEPDHLHVAARYVPASGSDQVGGDWYDAFLTPDGATELAIGDVTGHDIVAAATMGQLRSILRGYGVDRDEVPSQTLRRLDRAMTALRIDTLATVLLARVEQTDSDERAGLRRLRWSSAGHPPPVLVHDDGRTEVLWRAADPLLGLGTEPDRHDHVVALPPGSTLVLYTDGLVERRGEDLDAAIAALADQLGRLHHLPLEEVLDAVVATADQGGEDDVVVLAVRLHPEDRPTP
jgi:serine phosphatase RsbU (regulator of sigma subunit)